MFKTVHNPFLIYKKKKNTFQRTQIHIIFQSTTIPISIKLRLNEKKLKYLIFKMLFFKVEIYHTIDAHGKDKASIFYFSFSSLIQTN